MTERPLVLFVLALIAALVESAGPLAAAPAFTLEKTIPLPGVSGRIDHMDFDAGSSRLFVACLGDSSVQVVSVISGTITGKISGLSEPQGVALVPELRKLYVTNGGSGICGVYDADSLKALARIDLGEDADNIHYDAGRHLLFVSAGETIKAIRPAQDAVSASVSLPGHPEGFAFDAADPSLFVNVPGGARSVFLIDRDLMTVLHRWPAGGALSNLFSNFALGLDEKDKRLFVAARVPPSLLVLDAATGKQAASVKIDGDADDVFYDPGRSALYVSCGAGYLDVITQAGPDAYSAGQRVVTAPGARTSLWVPGTGTLFVAAPRRGNQDARILVYRVR